VRVRLALTDGTDLKVWKRGYHAKMIQPPAVFGHELVGEIVAVGKRVDPRWRIGMRVIAATLRLVCAAIIAAAAGKSLRRLLFNTEPTPTTCASPAASSSKICGSPALCRRSEPALAEPLACVLRGIHEMEVRTGDTAAVIGCAHRVEICPHAFAPRSARHRPGAAFSAAGCRQTLGAVAAITSRNARRRDRREGLPKTAGPDSVVEAAGNPATWQQAWRWSGAAAS